MILEPSQVPGKRVQARRGRAASSKRPAPRNRSSLSGATDETAWDAADADADEEVRDSENPDAFDDPDAAGNRSLEGDAVDEH